MNSTKKKLNSNINTIKNNNSFKHENIVQNYLS